MPQFSKFRKAIAAAVVAVGAVFTTFPDDPFSPKVLGAAVVAAVVAFFGVYFTPNAPQV